MTIKTRVFHQVSCDRCGALLHDGEHLWWDPDSVTDLLGEADWIVLQPDPHGDPEQFWRAQHFCFDCWTLVWEDEDESGDGIPTPLPPKGTP